MSGVWEKAQIYRKQIFVATASMKELKFLPVPQKMSIYLFLAVYISLQFAGGKGQGSVMFCVSALNSFLLNSP